MSVSDFLNAIKNDQVREDCRAIAHMMQDATNAEPKMCGASIVGFVDYKHQHAGSRQINRILIAFSPRKQNITLYLMPDFEQENDLRLLLDQLGKHSCGQSCCLYIKRLSDVDVPTLQKIIETTVRRVRETEREMNQ